MGDPPRALHGRPGLRTWFFTLAIGLLVLAASVIASHFVEARYSAVTAGVRDSEVRAIESIPPVGQRKIPAVIVFGSSLIEAAAMRAGLKEQFPSSFQLVILTGQLGSRAPIEDLMPVIRKVHPDLVLIEANLIHRPEDDPAFIRKLRHLEQAVFSRFRRRDDNPGAPPGSPASCAGLVQRKSAGVGDMVEQYRRLFPTHHLLMDRFPLLLDLQADGIQVGVLDMPRAAELEAAAPNLVGYRDALSAAMTKHGIAMWIAPGDWPADLFCDMSHLNHDGAILFDKWFSSRLKQSLNLPQ